MTGERSSTRRTRQTRLSFTPVHSSSPAPASPRFQPATVDFEGSPMKKRRVERETLVNEHMPKKRRLTVSMEIPSGLPTPTRSSQTEPAKNGSTSKPSISDAPDSDDESLAASFGKGKAADRRPRRKRQSRLDFSKHETAPSTSVADGITNDMPPPLFPDSSSRIKYGTRSGSDSDNTEDDVIPSSAARSKRTPPFSRRVQNSLQEISSEAPTSSTTRSGRKANPTVIEPSSDEEDEVQFLGSLRTKKGAADDPIDLYGSDSSAPEALQSSPMKKPRKSRKAPPPKDDFIVLSDEEEEPEPQPPVKKSKSKKRLKRYILDEVEDDVEDNLGDKEVPGQSDASQKRKSTRRSKRFIPDEQSEEDEDSELNSPSTVSQKYNAESPQKRRRLEQEQKDLAEDLDFLRSSPPAERSSPAKPKLDARKQALEKLKKRRTSRADHGGTSRRRVAYDSEDQDDSETDEVREDEFASDSDTYQGAYQDGSDEEDFVVEDDGNGPIGVPDIPLEFTNLARAKCRDLFKYVVEWMVQKKLNPAFSMDDEVYGMAFHKVDDEVKGLSGSKFTSSAWKQDFTISLQARPEIHTFELDGGERSLALHHCEACNRKSHPATYRIQFTGKPYNPQTLEEVDNGSFSDSDAESENSERGVEYDSKGRQVPPEDKIYHVGQFCMRNATTAHALEHWRIHLYEFIVDDLKLDGVLDADKIVERDSWKEKKRRKYANQVVDDMEREGQIKRLYRDFRNEIDTARHAKIVAYRGRH